MSFYLLVIVLVFADSGNRSFTGLSFESIDTFASNSTPEHLSPDGRTFICGLKDESGKQRLYEWRRRSSEARWLGPKLLPGEINDQSNILDNLQPTITADGFRIIFVRNPSNVWEGNDLWMASRPSRRDFFENIRPLTELNTDSSEAYPFISANGSRLYFTTSEGIMVARYNKIKDSFDRPRRLVLPWDAYFISCWLSEDELRIIVTGDGEVLCAQRAFLDVPFVDVRRLTLPELQAFVSSPSVDERGNLYLYASFYDVNASDGSMDGIITRDLILILRPKGGE